MQPQLIHRFDLDTVDATICLFAKHRLFQLDAAYQEMASFFQSKRLSYEVIIILQTTGEESRNWIQHIKEYFADGNSQFKIFQLPLTMQKATALKTVEKFIRGNIVLSIETGGILLASDTDKLMRKLAEGYDLVNGVRSWQSGPVVNKWQSQFFNWLTRRLTGSQVHDINSTVKIFRREVLENIPLYGDFYRFMPILAERRGFRIGEAAIFLRDDKIKTTVHGLFSYLRRFLDILNLVFLIRFTEKPLRFFGGLGITFAISGILLNTWLVFQKFVMHIALGNRPILLLAILFVIVGVQFISIGLIGEMILYSRSADFKPSEIEVVD